MCEFISWKKGSYGNIFFLTDKDVFSSHGRETLRGTRDNDVFGHGAITAFYGEATEHLAQKEEKRFWDKTLFPAQIAIHLGSPETLLDTWGKMLRRYLQPGDAYYILWYAPEAWRTALLDICLGHVAKNADYAYLTRFYVKGLTKAQKKLLGGGR